MTEPIIVTGGTNKDFLEQYARPGLIGLSGGTSLIDRTIGRAQRHLDTQKESSKWSHAFLFGGVRPDGYQWVIESDLQADRKHIRFGVQENRITKYYDDDYYSRLAILDFGITAEQFQIIICEALDLVASRTKYSLRELLGTAIALRHSSLRERENLFARPASYFCSAFVAHLFCRAGLEIIPGLPEKNTAPEDIFRSPAPHATFLLERPTQVKPNKVKLAVASVRQKVRARVKRG